MEKFLYVRPADDENVEMMWGSIPRFWGYPSKEALIASAKHHSAERNYGVPFNEDFDFDEFIERGHGQRCLEVVGPVWVYDVTATPIDSSTTDYYFKLCGPVTLHTKQHYYSEILIEPNHVMTDTESVYWARNAHLIQEDLVQEYLDHLKRSEEIEREWIQLLNKVRARHNLCMLNYEERTLGDG